MFRALQQHPEPLNVVPGGLWSVLNRFYELFERLGRQLSPPGSLWSSQEASCEPQTAAWNVWAINSSAQKAKWCSQTAQSSKQRANCIIEKAEDNGIFFALSVVKVAPQARPRTT